ESGGPELGRGGKWHSAATTRRNFLRDRAVYDFRYGQPHGLPIELPSVRHRDGSGHRDLFLRARSLWPGMVAVERNLRHQAHSRTRHVALGAHGHRLGVAGAQEDVSLKAIKSDRNIEA